MSEATASSQRGRDGTTAGSDEVPASPVRTQRRRWLKRTLLAPFSGVVRPWATRPPGSSAKALAIRRLVLPHLRADARYFERRFEDGRVFTGNTCDFLSLYVYIFGVWEPNLTLFLQSRLAAGDVFVDVGANVGWFSILAAKLVGPEGRVVSIEASPLLAAELVRNIELNRFPNVRAENAAAGSAPGWVDIVHGPAEHTGLTRVHQGTSVRRDTLQALIGEDDLSRVRLLKIDVEGAEYDVIEGFEPALRRLPEAAELVVEVGPQRASESARVEALFAAFDDAGFHPYALPNSYEPTGYVLDPVVTSLERVEGVPVSEIDVVFSRRDVPTLEVEASLG
jgi:FkbM family methyltransferase